ncbi:MAG: asparaginase [Nisaea sp.]|uniref:asparaginase n=1 Tax=Nisaea sp. TaxID=2024842 RepID=UPI001AFDAB3A|nr:asparaginase [Nisaea sp.]MBO6562730.1 asparaginase [Nisaea sp.]
MSKPKVAVIGTGGTIASIGKTPLDILDYGANKKMIGIEEIIAMFPIVHEVAEVVPVPYQAIPSPSVGFKEWRDLVLKIDELAKDPDLDGIVVTHGTASLEETAYALHLTVKADIPVVVVGSQRPSSALSTDAGFNLVNGIRTAGSPDAKGMGVMTLLNDEIQCAREVTKTSTYRMQTFRTPDFGCLGHADGDAVVFYRKPLRKHAPDTEFDIRKIDAMPRVDIAYAYTGSDGTACRAFLEAGAQGIVSAGFAPGFCGPGDEEVLREAVKKGVVVVQSTRAGSGRTFMSTKIKECGFLIADNLNPQKARILLSLALTVTKDPDEIARIFQTY